MMYRKTFLFFSALLLLLSSACTTRYQDMLHERDARIRELNNDVARLRGENDDLLRREQAAQAALRDASVQPSANLGSAELDRLQDMVGADAQVSYVRGRISFGVNDKITFSSGSTALKGSASDVLRRIAQTIQSQHPGKRIYVEGHTDSDPIVKTKDKFRDNLHLSTERASAVARHLISQGVPKSSIAVVGFGQYDPIGSKEQNRRVQVVIGDAIR